MLEYSAWPTMECIDYAANKLLTGGEIAMEPGACQKALVKLENLDDQIRGLVKKQQQQQANILHNCDLIFSTHE